MHSKLQCSTLVRICIYFCILVWRLLMCPSDVTHVLDQIKGYGQLIGIYITFALNRSSNFLGQEAGESLVIRAGGLSRFHGREKESFITCLYPLLVRRDQWWPNFHRAGYFPHQYFAAAYVCSAEGYASSHASVHVGTLVWKWRRVNFQACVAAALVVNNHELSSCLVAVVEIKDFCSRFARISKVTSVLRYTLIERPADSVSQDVPAIISIVFPLFC